MIAGFSAFTIGVTLYQFVVKRVNVLRFLFGMKPPKRLDVRSGVALAAQR
ncbi:MAG: hypothetical protein HY870_21195 [Chloroflexi bacterium]|nr:hypothetical protein [Chloroflexota bacterium]